MPDKMIALYFFALLSCTFAACSWEEPTKPVIYISVFDSVGVLPNSFSIDAKNISNEFRLQGDNGSVIVGQGDIKKKLELMQYLEKVKTGQRKICGVTVIDGGAEDVKIHAAYDENNYLFFAGIDEEMVSTFFNVLCETKGDSGKK